MTIQTAFRLDESMVKMMKNRAKSKGLSVNAYVSELISQDLKSSMSLPTVRIPEQLDSDIMRFSGTMRTPTEDELASDERLRRIWER